MNRGLTLIAIVVPLAVVAIADWWIVSAGRWTNWPEYSARTDQLADAFRHGSVALLEPPPSELVALPNPYDAKANRAFREQGAHDLALFHGRYYLYWGPVPALLLAAVKSVVPGRGVVVGDQYITFTFTLLELLASAALFHHLWSRYFPRAPRWTLSLAVLAAGVVTPMPFMLARASAYEVAIIAGQFFLLLGAYFAFRALNAGCATDSQRAQRDEETFSVPSVPLWHILFCGIAWAAAIGSRISLAPWIAVMCVGVIYACRRRRTAALFVGVPIILSVLALLGYNAARFGAITESGVRYMLASNSAQRAILGGHMFGVQYAPANVVNYLVTPPNISPTFPFVTPKIYGLGLLRRHYEPRFYHVNTVAGLITTSPFLLLAIVPPIVWLREGQPNWIALGLTAAGIVAAIAPVLLLYNCTMRYLADWTPTLAMLAAVGWWMIESRAAPRRWVWRGLILATILYSSVVGILFGVTGYANHFKLQNPELYEELSCVTPAPAGSSGVTNAAT